jgi:hypothetical protein
MLRVLILARIKQIVRSPYCATRHPLCLHVCHLACYHGERFRNSERSLLLSTVLRQQNMCTVPWWLFAVVLAALHQVLCLANSTLMADVCLIRIQHLVAILLDYVAPSCRRPKFASKVAQGKCVNWNLDMYVWDVNQDWECFDSYQNGNRTSLGRASDKGKYN